MIKTQSELNNVFRSVAYHIAFTTVTLAMGIMYLPLLAMKHPKLKAEIPLKWTAIALKLQRHILQLDYQVHVKTPLPQGNAVYAVKHQSAWETIALWHILDCPVFVLKKELLKIPVFGWYLAQADNIVIDRSSGQKAIGQIIEQGMKYLMQGRNIVIFPEGTRTMVGQSQRYKTGIANLYEALSPEIFPVALNSGVFWPRNSLIRKAGTVEIEILPALPQELSKQEFMELLQTTIETHSQALIGSAKFPEDPDYY